MQAREFRDVRSATPRHQDDLDVRPQARLDRPGAEQGHATLAVVQQRSPTPEERAVQIEVAGPARLPVHRRLAIGGRSCGGSTVRGSRPSNGPGSSSDSRPARARRSAIT